MTVAGFSAHERRTSSTKQLLPYHIETKVLPAQKQSDASATSSYRTVARHVLQATSTGGSLVSLSKGKRFGGASLCGAVAAARRVRSNMAMARIEVWTTYHFIDTPCSLNRNNTVR